jgi:hypothetical protein
MKPREWYRAEIRWALMEEGKRGLRAWEDAVYFFLSEDQDAAFQQALEIGWRERDGREEGRRWVEKRLAQIVSLQCMGVTQGSLRFPWAFRAPRNGCHSSANFTRRVQSYGPFLTAGVL